MDILIGEGVNGTAKLVIFNVCLLSQKSKNLSLLLLYYKN